MMKEIRPPLFAHQEETVQYLMTKRCAAVLSEQGTGKTRSVIEFVNRKFPYAPYHVLVVCPSTLMNVWQSEIQKFSDFKKTYILKGSSSQRIKMIEVFNPGWYVINYEGLRAVRNKTNIVAGGRDWAVVIADEMTRIKNPTAKQSKAMHDFSREGNFDPIRIGMTGTPITQSPLDVFSQYKFVEPRLFGSEFFRFKARYAIEEKQYMGSRSFNKIVGYKHTEEITSKMYEVSIRHTKKQCLDLPPKIFQKIQVEWDKEHRKIYDSLCIELIAEFEDTVIAVPNALSKLAKLRQVCGGYVYKEYGGITRLIKNPEKLKALNELIEDTPGQLIVWAYFKQDIEDICNLLKHIKCGYTRITGREDIDQRQQAVDAFQKGSFKVIVVQCGVGQYGITLTNAQTAIFYSQGFSAEERMQAEDRSHRIGTKTSVLYIDLVMKDSVEEGICQVLDAKKVMATTLTDNTMSSAEIRNLVTGKRV